jgi:mono/diheme cytochrome c family protein
MRWRSWLIGIGVVLAATFTVGSALAQTAGDPERGGGLYVENCAVCHGVDGQGRIGASLTQFPGIQVDATLEQAIADGIDGSVMPAWSLENGGPFSRQDISDVAAYILGAFEGTEPLAPLPTYQPSPVPTLADVSGNPALGAAVYQANCAVCHGQDGQGRIGETLAKVWPGNQPEMYLRQVVAEGVPGTTMPAWGRADGGPLTDEEIADVSAFVLGLQPAPSQQPEAPGSGPISLTAGLIALGILLLLAALGLLVYYRRS